MEKSLNLKNNFYFKMFVKACKICGFNDIKLDKIIIEEISLFDENFAKLPHLIFCQGKSKEFADVYCSLIIEQYLKDTVSLLKDYGYKNGLISSCETTKILDEDKLYSLMHLPKHQKNVLMHELTKMHYFYFLRRHFGIGTTITFRKKDIFNVFYKKDII